MSDIYKTPKSNLGEDNDKSFKPNIFWKLLFWLHISFALTLPALISFLEDLSLLDAIDVFMFLVITIGLWGFVYSKKVFNIVIWKLTSIFFPFWVLVYGLVLPFGFGFPRYGEPTNLDAWLLLDMILYIPSCFAMYFYANKSSQIWRP